MPDGIEIKDVLNVLWRRRAAMAGTFAIGLALGIWIINGLETRYTAETTLVLEVANNQPVDVKAVAGSLTNDTALINSEIDVLRSSGLAEEVVDELDLTADPEFNPLLRPVDLGWLASIGLLEVLPRPMRSWLEPEQPELVPQEQERAMVVDAVRSKLRVENDGESYTIRLYFEAGSPALAAAIANAFADLYLLGRIRGKQEATQRAGQWVQSKLAELDRQVTVADRAALAFREQHQLVEVAGDSLVDMQLAALGQELAAAAANRARRESALQEIRRAMSSGGNFATVEVASSPLVQELRSQQNLLRSQRAELQAQLGPRHPRIVEIENRLAEAEERLEQEVGRVLSELETSVRVARAEERALTEQLEQLKAQRDAAERAGIELRQLDSKSIAARIMFDAFAEGFSRTSAEVGVSEPDARILTRAAPPLQPSFPPRTLLMVLTAFVSCLLVVVAAAVLEAADRGFRDPADLERAHGFPVLGLIPLSKQRGVGCQHPSMDVIDRPFSRFTEAVQSVSVSLGYARPDQASQVTLITSSAPDEGKTALAIALGRLAACSGRRVLLIDCDLRRPSVAGDLNQPCEHGLVEFVDGSVSIDQVLKFDEPSGLAFIPAIGTVPYPAEVCSSKFFQGLIEQARREFDLVILDSPPVGLVSDALVLSRLADATLLVVRWGKTPQPAVAAAVKKLRAAGSRVTAAIFSHVDLKRCASYTYYPLDFSDRYFADLEGRAEAFGRTG